MMVIIVSRNVVYLVYEGAQVPPKFLEIKRRQSKGHSEKLIVLMLYILYIRVVVKEKNV